ncbi:MAG: hypothetical protein ACRDTM_02565 [Micromonosporaceae bacterium]
MALVVTEGNYLLVWDGVADLLDESWYVELDEPTRLARLVDRHVGLNGQSVRTAVSYLWKGLRRAEQ